MTLVPITLSNRSNPARYKQGGTASLVNCYVEKIGEDGKVPWAVHASDGLQGFVNISEANGPVRAMLVVSGYLWAIVGTGLYRIEANGNYTLIGSMNISATAPVYMERNRRAVPDISIVCDGLMYNYRTSLAQVTDVDLLAPVSLAFVDGYFVIGTADNTWQIGALDDGTAWDGLDVERADSNPDDVIRVASLQQDAIIFGEKSTEFWRNTGANPFPFERVTANDIGCLAPGSVATVEQTLAWVAHDRTVRMLAGYEAKRISTHAVERDIEDLADHTTIKATSWVKDGHTFYKLSSDSWTWVYDTTTNFWHQRETYGEANWRVGPVIAFDGKIIAGSLDDGKFYEMSADFQDDAGVPLVLEATMPPTHAYPNWLTFNCLYIDIEKGVGTGQGDAQDVDPELILSWSDDGGVTFTGYRTLKMGQQGQRSRRIETHRLGQSKADGRVFRITCSAKVARALYQIQADVTKDRA